MCKINCKVEIVFSDSFKRNIFSKILEIFSAKLMTIPMGIKVTAS